MKRGQQGETADSLRVKFQLAVLRGDRSAAEVLVKKLARAVAADGRRSRV